jgi:hypothetical protein
MLTPVHIFQTHILLTPSLGFACHPKVAAFATEGSEQAARSVASFATQ